MATWSKGVILFKIEACHTKNYYKHHNYGSKLCYFYFQSIHYLELITDKILAILMLKCNCQYSTKYIKHQRFNQSQHSTLITYRARIYSTDEIEATALTEHLQEWINTDGILINETELFVTVDTNCGLAINSFDTILCDNPKLLTTTKAMSALLFSTTFMKQIAQTAERTTEHTAASHTFQYTSSLLLTNTTERLMLTNAASSTTKTVEINSTDPQQQIMLILIGICGLTSCAWILGFLILTVTIVINKSKKKER